MQHTDHFDVLLKDTVNLSQPKLDVLSERVEAIYQALRKDEEIGSLVQDKLPQGSWAHRTIINPVGNNEFDADFMLQMEENPDWSDSPKTYVEQVYAALHRNSTYKNMPHTRKCRCVQLTYANSMHVDIVPYLTLSNGRQVIVNRDEDDWEDTNPEGFTAWMHDKDGVAGGNLRKVIRLMKYLRDHKNSFTGTRSIILTTLLGEQVASIRKLNEPGYYSNIPTALFHIVRDLDEWLQERPTKPSIVDPSGAAAPDGSRVAFDHRWDQSTYSYFRERIHIHAAEIEAAYYEPDKEESFRRWQTIFGDGFKAPEPSTNGRKFPASASAAAVATTTVGRSGRAG
ncbi:UNVERIFIED_CONTAM: nucleotidyltransferase [Kocuria sp. CPCC 205316]|uniref:SMODS domain-containing nucleotidyltransferase n=1 Tax=Kocuria TaxID=57493 RepID=UPI0036D94005